jgi:hypothetical protein
MTERSNERPIDAAARTRRHLPGGVLLVALALLMVLPASSLAAPIAAGHAAPAAPAATAVPAAASPSGLPSSLAHASPTILNAIDHHLTSPSFAALRAMTPAQLRYNVPVGDPAAAPTLAPAHPASIADNSQLPGSDCAGWGNHLFVPFMAGSNIVQVGTSNQTLLAAGGSQNQLFNSTGNTPCTSGTVEPWFYALGYSAIWSTSDGGATWSQSPIPRNITHWQTPGDVNNGSVTTGSAVVAAAANDLAVAITGFGPACVMGVPYNCSSAPGLQAPWGYAVSHSTNGGASWSNATQLNTQESLIWITFPSTCSSVGLTSNYYVNNLTENPWIATDGTNVVAGWDVFMENWDPATCSNAPQAVVQVAISSNGGATFGAPFAISNAVSDTMQVAVGPTAGTFYAVYSDFANATAQTTPIGFVKTTNGGATWSTEKDTGTAYVDRVSAIDTSPTAISPVQRAVLAVDNYSGSPHSGNLYVVWEDNQSGVNAGIPVIDFIMSSNGGTSWTSPVQITPTSSSENYIQPTAGVSPNGTLWVTYYGIAEKGAGVGSYNLYGMYSTDAGTTWSSQFTISSAASFPGQNIVDIGFYQGIAGIGNGIASTWSDCRTSACSVSNDVQYYTADTNPIAITSNAPLADNLQANVTVFGTTTRATLPTATAFDLGASVSVTVPSSVAYNATYIDAFVGWSGAVTTSSFTASFTFAGERSLVATYAPERASFIAGYVTPNVAGVALTLDGNNVALLAYNTTSYQYHVTVAAGNSYTLVASAPSYTTQTVIVPTVSGGTVWQNFTLVKLKGTIVGTVVPTSATLTIDQVAISAADINRTSGAYSIPLDFGSYWFNASATGYVSSSHYLTVYAGQSTPWSFNLTGGAISGIVTNPKTGLAVSINGKPVTDVVAGTFTVNEPGGIYIVAATQPGYNLVTNSSVVVVAGATTSVSITLTNHGWLAGTIAPQAALKSLVLTVTNSTYSSQSGPVPFSATTGTFNQSLPGPAYWTVTLTAPGYTTVSQKFLVTPGNATTASETLQASGPTGGGNCTTNNTCPPPNGGTKASSGVPLLDWIIVAIVILAVAAVLAIALMRRRGGSTTTVQTTTTQPSEAVYEDSNPSDLPKLQTDGSMGPGGSPPPE